MTYVWIFGGCYVAAFAVVLSMFKNKNDLAAIRLRENGATPEAVRNFYREVNRKSTLYLVWAIFLLGSIAGAIVSTAYSVTK